MASGWNFERGGRLKTCDTAECNSALRGIRRRGTAGLSSIELLAVVGLLVVVVLVAISAVSNQSRKREADGLRCERNLRNIGLAFRIFATDHNDRFPAPFMERNGGELTSIDLLMVYRSMSNLLSTPRVLHCPSDPKGRNDSTNFNTMTLQNISYFTSLSADEHLPQVMLGGDRNLATNGVAVGSGFFAMGTNAQVGWTKVLHVEMGQVVMSDGSVQQLSSSRLKASLKDQDIATNYLVIP